MIVSLSAASSYFKRNIHTSRVHTPHPVQTGSEALAMMSDAPELFTHYHDGFQQQTKGWPEQPVDIAARCVDICRSMRGFAVEGD